MTFEEYWKTAAGGYGQGKTFRAWSWIDGFSQEAGELLWEAAQDALRQELAKKDSDNA